MKQVITNKMELKEEQPTNEIRQNKFEVYTEYNNLDIINYLNHYSQFSEGYNDIELTNDAQCKSIQFIRKIEEQNIHRQNNEIIYKQVNRKEINFRGPWNLIKNDGNISLNSICTLSPDSTYCSIDLNELLIFKRYVFYIMELLVTEKVNLSQRSKAHLSISDTHMSLKLRHPGHKSRKINHKLCNVINNNRRKQLCNGEMKSMESLIPKEHCLSFDDIQRSKFAIPLERQGIDFKISICKYSTPNLFYKLTKMCNSCIPLSPDSASVNMFSLSIGKWYFLNISQGYSLKLLLRNVNVSTLSVMLQLYFILITHAHPNLSIQMNFRMKPELFTILENLYFKPFSFKLVDWRGDHKFVLRSTFLRFFNTYNDERLQLKWPILPYAKMERPSEIESVIQIVDYEEKSGKEHEDAILQPVLHNICEDENYIRTSELQSEDEDSINSFDTVLPESPTDPEYNIQPPEPYKKYSDMFKWDNLTDVEKISLINSIENLSLHKEAEELNKSDVTLLNILFAYGISNFSVIQSKLWVRQRFDDMKMYLNLHDIFKCDNIINETMFDRTSVNLYEKYCKPIFNQKFVVITLHNLGKSLGNILFNIN